MEKAPIISVIIPAYKVEKYIGRCLKKLEAQTFTDFEVLVINDGSPDRTAEVVEEFAKRDKRFILFNNENGGVASTRNFGVEHARGEYLAFVDSDDYVHKDYLKILYEECINNDADISCCRFRYTYFKTRICLPMLTAPKKAVIESDKAYELIVRDSKIRSYLWNKLYKRELFFDHDIRYPEMYFEDLATTPRVLYYSRRIAISERYLYYYEKHFGSIMSTMSSGKINDYWRGVFIIRNFTQYVGKYSQYRDACRSLARKAHLINIYSIVRQHLLHLDFRKMKYNLDLNRDIYAYVIDDDYKAVEGTPDLPLKLHQPGWKANRGKDLSQLKKRPRPKKK